MATDRKVIVLGVAIIGAGIIAWRRCTPTPVDTVDIHTGGAPADDAGSRVVGQALGQALGRPALAGRSDAARVAPVDAVDDAPLAAATIKHGFDDAHAHIRDLVAPCFRDHAKPQMLAFRYRLIVVSGRAEIAEPAIIEADVALADTQACLITALDSAEWSTSLPDMETPLEDQLVRAEL